VASLEEVVIVIVIGGNGWWCADICTKVQVAYNICFVFTLAGFFRD